jgi:peroxiredoxin Q/BCP
MVQRDAVPIPAESDGRSRTVIKEGDAAPDFALVADDGSTVTLDSLKGRNVVLFFYPKDNTSG